MKSLIYQFRRARLAGTLNLLGMALTLAGVYVLFTQTLYTLQYNRCFPGYRNIYRVECRGEFGDDKWTVHISRPLAAEIGELPVVKEMVVSQPIGTWAFDKDGSDVYRDVIRSNGRMLVLLGAQCVDGRLDLREGKDDGSLVIPASLAVQYFGRENAAGEQMLTKDGRMRDVVGIYRDFPDNCFIRNCVHMLLPEEGKDDWSEWSFPVYIRVKDGTPHETVDEAMHGFYRKLVEKQTGKKAGEFTAEEQAAIDRIEFKALPLYETYFSGHALEDQGSRTALFMQEFVILLLIVTCMVNFANYSMGQAPGRIRSLTIRKVLGEHTWRLRLHLLGEGLVTGMLAWLLALALLCATAGRPWVAQLFTASLLPADNAVPLAVMLVLAAVTGTVPVIYSSWYATSFTPATAMKGNVGLSPHGKSLRQWLVGIQLCTAMVMAVFMGVISSQSHYIYSSSYGYAKDSILLFPMGDIPMEKKPVVRQELEKLPGVASVSFSHSVLGELDNGMTWGRGNGDKHYSFRCFPVDWKYLRTYGIRILEGRDFKEGDGDVYIFNKAMKDLYPEIETGKPLYDGDLTVVGICDNVRAGSVRVDNSQTPIAFVIFGEKYAEWGDRCNNVCVRLAGGADIRQTRHEIEDVLDGLTEGARPDMTFLDNRLEQTYRAEGHFIRLIRLGSMLMLAITLIGVFCLTMFETEYRRKEIAIRKVMGSTVGQVLMLFVARYTWPLAVSFVFAAPLGYLLGSRWLENFAERTAIHWWLFPMALLAVTVVVSATVVMQSWRAATSNPVDSIRTE